MKEKYIEIDVTVKINPSNRKNCGVLHKDKLVGCDYLTVWDIGTYYCFLFKKAVIKDANNCFKRCDSCIAATESSSRREKT